ncbi:MAG: carbohydrate binding domain-containing protein [Spirochaetales bacterium]|nr:carbohydrate binding domain-containing protein [Spirochaetales bacterium]
MKRGLFLFIIIIILAGCVSTGKKEETPPVVKEEEPEEIGEVIYSSGFETGELEAWSPKGTVMMEVTDACVHSGEYSLIATQRNETWHAPELVITDMIQDNWKYTAVVWVYIPEENPAAKIKLTVQTNAGGKMNWIEIAKPVNTPPGQWTEIRGKYAHSGSFDTVSLYIECLDATADFYVDDIEIFGLGS